MLREVWPEGDVFGSADVEPEEELELLKQILQAKLPSKYQSVYLSLLCKSLHAGFKPLLLTSGSSQTAVVEEEEEEDDGPEMEEEELESVQVSETEFKFLDFIKR